MTVKALRSNAGFTYLAAIVMVVIMGIMLAKAAVYWSTKMQREREVELIFRGTQYRDALRRWYKLVPTTGGSPGIATAQPSVIPPGIAPPGELKDLLQDTRSAGKVRYLRRLYLDPMTGKEFVPVKDASQRIVGVRSASEAQPIKQANFPLDLEPSDFEAKKKYSDWQFICTHWPKPGATGGGVTGLPGTTGPGGSGSGGQGSTGTGATATRPTGP